MLYYLQSYMHLVNYIELDKSLVIFSSLKNENNKKAVTKRTKYEVIKAWIRHKLIDEKPFPSFQAEAKKPDQIPMLKLGH